MMHRVLRSISVIVLALLAFPGVARADEANLILPSLEGAQVMGMNGRTLLSFGMVVCLLGMGFGLWMYSQLKGMPVHKAMLDVSELIYETCKTYLVTQIKFVLLLEAFVGPII